MNHFKSRRIHWICLWKIFSSGKKEKKSFLIWLLKIEAIFMQMISKQFMSTHFGPPRKFCWILSKPASYNFTCDKFLYIFERIEELEQHVISVIDYDIPLPVVVSIGDASVQYHILSKTRRIILDLWNLQILDFTWETLELTSLIFGFILHDLRVLYDKIIVMIEHIQNLGQIWNRFDFFYALGKWFHIRIFMKRP